MKPDVNRRRFLKLTGASIGIGTLYTLAPPAFGASAEIMSYLGQKTGENVTPFSFVQLSDPHVGFDGPPDPLGTKAFEQAVAMVNNLDTPPDLVLFTGDLIHDTEDKDEHVKRIKRFKEISSGLRVGKVKHVPGEHDAGLDSGTIYRDHFGETSYSFDHRGVHFVALDNVTRAKPEVGQAQTEWLKRDLARFPKEAPIVIFTHRPLFDLKPEWEWFTSDGDDVMNALAPYQNVTVLYGHIHTEHTDKIANVNHYGARSLVFAFPDPAQSPAKKPMPFDKANPFKNLGIRELRSERDTPLNVKDVELTLQEFGGVNGVQQMFKEVEL
ncbi:MAG TPA: metallophosphoesterase [Terriglobales bacterium]